MVIVIETIVTDRCLLIPDLEKNQASCGRETQLTGRHGESPELQRLPS